jgi:hypothetical protein
MTATGRRPVRAVADATAYIGKSMAAGAILSGEPIMSWSPCLLAAIALAAEPNPAITPYVNDATVAVVRVQPAKLKLSVAATVILKELKLEAAESIAVSLAAGVVEGWLNKLTKAGVTEVYAVIGSPPPPAIPVQVIVPLADGVDAESVKSILAAGPFPDAERWPKPFSWVRAGKGVVTAGWDQEPAKVAAQARPDITAAFAMAHDAPFQAVLVPPEVLRRLLEESLPRLPEPIGGPSSILARGFQGAALSVTLPPELSVRLSMQAKDAEAAEALAEIWNRGMLFAAQMAPANIRDNVVPMTKAAQAKVTKDRLSVELTDVGPALTAVREGLQAARQEAMRAASMGHLKQLGVAMHNYHDVHQRFPSAAICDKNGKPLLSWRVAVLPYLEQQRLYEQFHLDEPWDSKHNKKLIAKMPAVFRHRSSKADKGQATLLAPRGPGTIFPDVSTKTKLQDIKDGASNTIMLVDVTDEQAVPWTKPDDWTFDPKHPTKGLAMRDGQAMVLYSDGSVHILKAELPPATWAGLFTIAGGEVLELEK